MWASPLLSRAVSAAVPKLIPKNTRDAPSANSVSTVAQIVSVTIGARATKMNVKHLL